MDVSEMLKELIAYQESWNEDHTKKITLLSSLKERLTELDLPIEKLQVITGQYVDFNRLSHEEVIRLIAFFGGKWKKELNNERIDYETTTDDGITIRAWAGEPPPSCKIIEVEEYVPASVRTVRKLQCPESLSND